MKADPRFQVHVDFPDLATEPVSEARLAELLAQGMPREAVREDRTLDPEVLRKHGWWVEGPWVAGPPA